MEKFNKNVNKCLSANVLYMNKRIVVITILVLLATSILWFPAVVFALSGCPEKFDYYVKALEYMFKGLVEYFKWVVELFKVAISS